VLATVIRHVIVKELMKDKVIDYYKEFYYKELERNDKINSSLSLPFGVVSLTISALIFYIQNIKFDSSWPSVALAVLLATYFISIVISIGYLLRVFFVSNYSHMPDPLDIEHYRLGLEEYYRSENPVEYEALSQNEFKDFLVSRFSESTTKNTFNNDRKAYFLYLAKIWIIVSLTALLVSTVPALITYIQQKSDLPIKTLNGKGVIENAK